VSVDVLAAFVAALRCVSRRSMKISASMAHGPTGSTNTTE
jgi:hypothetical protein